MVTANGQASEGLGLLKRNHWHLFLLPNHFFFFFHLCFSILAPTQLGV